MLKYENEKYDYIIYHKGCPDGFAGYFVAHYSGALERNHSIWASNPNSKKIPINIKNKRVLVIDVAYKKNIVEAIIKEAKYVTFIDHHVTIHNDISSLKYSNFKYVYDEYTSGCVLTWNYFIKGQNVPLFLSYIDDRDTGRSLLKYTKPFLHGLKTNYHLSTDPKSLGKWAKLMEKNTVTKLIQEGIIYEKMYNQILATNSAKHSLFSFPSKLIYDLKPSIFDKVGQYKVAVFCGHGCPSITDLAEETLSRYRDYDFCIMWCMDLVSNMYMLSFRSNNVDVSKISEIFDGGGHKGAASGNIYTSQYNLIDLFHKPLKKVNINLSLII